jgi:hypothetical protein
MVGTKSANYLATHFYYKTFYLFQISLKVQDENFGVSPKMEQRILDTNAGKQLS